ncbi:MAG: type II secretion system F family protein [Microthrixaceae bacterium]
MSEILQLDGVGAIFAVVTALSGAFLVAGIGQLVLDRVSLRSKLRGIDDLYKFVDVRDQELMLPFADRVAAPMLGALSKLGWRFSPAGRVEQIRVMLRRAGRPEVDTDRYLALRVLSILASPFAAYAAWTLAASQGRMLRLICTGLAVSCCTILPSRRLRSAVESREELILRQLPDIMDLLVICMEAGLGFTSAVSRTVANIDGEMSDEFALALGEMRAGASRADALSGLAERVHLPQVRSFVMAIRQADQFGISVSTVLRNQADEMRVTRRQIAQEKAQKAPVKMLVPMVFCIFPPMFIVVIGPAGLAMSASGGF